LLLLAPLLDGCASDYVPRPIDTGGDPPSTVPVTDLDADGYTPDAGDCDDLDPAVGPGFHESCDGKDNDCDGLVDYAGPTDDRCALIDTFQQTMQADVLVVLNNSTRMKSAGYWDQAAAGSYEMATHLIGAGADTHIGVVLDDLTDLQYSGLLVAPNQFANRWLQGDATTPTDAQVFLDGMSDRDDPSDANPKGMRAGVEAALSLAQEQGGPNLGFFRPASRLFAVVMFTDVDDTLYPYDAQFLTDLTADKLGSLDKVRIYAVTQTTGYDCDHRRVNEAVSVVSLAQQTDGFYESLCMDDWTGFMSSVGQDIAKQSLQSEFKLGSVPRLDSTFVIRITKDKTTYRWDGEFAIEDSTTLVFPDARPPPGASIEVDYDADWRYSE